MQNHHSFPLRSLLLLIAFTTPFLALAEPPEKKSKSETGVSNPATFAKAAACSPAVALKTMNYNDVSALIETGGSMWQNRSTGGAAYFVPKDSEAASLFAGALWMGGVSPDQQLKLAAVTFRDVGNDFWTGPLSNESAEVSSETCQAYDRFFDSYKVDAQLHRQFYLCKDDPDCDLEDEFPNGYVYPTYFDEWPAHGDPAKGQDFYLAPFFDYAPAGEEPDGLYDPSSGDYPFYDLDQSINCKTRLREDVPPLFGDRNFYWIFNDKGNIHTESQGQPIGMEIRAQAFAFGTQDEINKMTFYNYLLINQGTQTLTETYFGQWADADIGLATNDVVGCDVQRGLGYTYNGPELDGTGAPGSFGANPPAVGIDFFEGPYQDSDGKDNPLTDTLATGNYEIALAEDGIPYKGLGIGYGDGVIDNERFGMRKFVFYNNNSSAIGNPTNEVEHYNYLRGIDRLGAAIGVDGKPMDYMFPGDSDPYGWGTGGETLEPWYDGTTSSPAGDRRFIQSAGPFVLEPGSYNNITVGVVWARANSGGPSASVELLLQADDKAQSLFDNCFNVISGPDAPDITVQELDREIILLLSNSDASSNKGEKYMKFDPSTPDTWNGQPLTEEERTYFFQGYKIYQLKSASVSAADLDDIEQARLIYTVDKQDDITQIINWDFDPTMGLAVPDERVNGPDQGIDHSFQVTEDQFALGDKRLVNFKTYHFMAIAYAHNSYAPYDPTNGVGQAKPYLPSSKSSVGALRSYSGIPHCTSPEAGGTITSLAFGDGVRITQSEGRGNARNLLQLAPGEEIRILANENGPLDEITFAAGFGPVKIKVIDPVRIKGSDFSLRLISPEEDLENTTVNWELTDLKTGEVISSDQSIAIRNEQILTNQGISITIEQYENVNSSFIEPLGASLTYEDSSYPWLQGLGDQDGFTPLNWIRSGTSETTDGPAIEEIFDDYLSLQNSDPDQAFEDLLGGTWAPYQLVSYSDKIDHDDDPATPTAWFPSVAPTVDGLQEDLSINHKLADLNNVDVVFTSDRELWTRCAVLEMNPDPSFVEQQYSTSLTDNEPKMLLRNHASVDKYGLSVAEGGDPNDATLNGNQPYGMGWFPGYAIDLNTGERLNMAFGEDSFLGTENGRDMLWNPGSTAVGPAGQIIAGGQHWIYVFRNSQWYEDRAPTDSNPDITRVGGYDQGQALFTLLSNGNEKNAMRCCTWVGSALSSAEFPMLTLEKGLIPSETRVVLRVTTPYSLQSTTYTDLEDENGLAQSLNDWKPLYRFSTQADKTQFNKQEALVEALAKINVVPNPYYGNSEYEANKLDNRVKITNLPEDCEVSIYTVGGALVRNYKKSSPLTFLDWDLKNGNSIPIASGVYIIHIQVDGVGERVLKWFGVIRPTDLDAF